MSGIIKVVGSVALAYYIWSPVLNVINIVDVASHSALHVCDDDVKDVTADAIMNKMEEHTTVTTDIATVVEEILHEDEIKAVDL